MGHPPDGRTRPAEGIRGRVGIEHTVAALDIPLARAPAVGEEAQRITFWTAPGARYLTGSQFTADGGALPALQHRRFADTAGPAPPGSWS
jgi:hypothetical protein